MDILSKKLDLATHNRRINYSNSKYKILHFPMSAVISQIDNYCHSFVSILAAPTPYTALHFQFHSDYVLYS